MPGGAQGVLLIHGFTGSPSEMSLLADYLHKNGYTVYSVRLPGHGTKVEDLNKTSFWQWIAAVEDAERLLQGMCTQVSVVGMSMGGLLALHLACHFPIHKLVCLATPIFIIDKRLPLLTVYGFFKEYVTKRQRIYDLKLHMRYDRMPVKSVREMVQLLQQVKLLLPQIKTPCLVMQSAVEHTLKPESAEHIYNNVGSAHKKLIWKYHSGHLLVLDKERASVFQDILDFLEGDIHGY